MAPAKNDHDKPNLWTLVTVFLLRIADSGLLPWAIVAAFVLALCYLLTRNLDSKDTLSFLNGIGTLRGFAWIGWLVALLEIPMYHWFAKRTRRGQDAHIQRIEAENEKAREMLKKFKQEEFKLEKP